MGYLVDTNILVYRFDPRFPEKQEIATRLLREGIESGEARLSHQGMVEFVAAVTRPLRRGEGALLTPAEACQAAEELMYQFTVLYPVEGVLRLAMRGSATYLLSWFDAQMWAYAEFFGLSELYSEDMQNGRRYGTVLVVNPF